MTCIYIIENNMVSKLHREHIGQREIPHFLASRSIDKLLCRSFQAKE